MQFRNRRLNAIVLRLGLALVILSGLGFVQRTNDEYFEVSKNLDIFGKVLREVHINYVEPVETNQFVRKGLDAMLSSLDPFTNFISSSEIEDFRFMSTGEYGGIGARITKREGRFLVLEVYEDSPAEKGGLKPGDEIIQIDDEQVENKEFTTLDVRNLLRGEAEKSVQVIVQRMGQAEPVPVEIVRNKVKVPNVPHYSMVSDEIGYVSLQSFTRNASGELKSALRNLKDDHPDVEGVVLDLRGNPGGLLFEAIKISNLFVPKGETIVETKGRIEGSEKVYQARNSAYDLDIPLVVLINSSSASASEIVSGVMQDLDRGVVIGRRSYGKGLVQTTRPLSYNNQLKITTAHYYTPSGRNIQAIDYSERNEDGSVIRTPDSLRQIYETEGGRSVKGGGGIDPDIAVKKDEPHQITKQLLNKYLIFDFATKYVQEHPEPVNPREFTISDKLYKDFVAYVRSQDFEYKSDMEKEYRKFRKQLKDEKYYDKLAEDLKHLRKEIRSHSEDDILAYKEEIADALRLEIVERYHHKDGRLAANFKSDLDIKKAVEVLQDQELYGSILAGTYELPEEPIDPDEELDKELEKE